ncbi:MAG: hypothetical protein HRT61_24555 [Ekhidna sp.]|nr:hypothetical protein [Ekhidna sp.]
MSTHSSSENSGCAQALVGIFALVMLIAIAEALIAFLIQLLYILFTVAIVAGIGYLLYKVESQNQSVSRLFSNLFSSANYSIEQRQTFHHNEQQPKLLTEGKEDKLLETLSSLDATLKRFNDRMDTQDKRIERIEEAIIELKESQKASANAQLDVLLNEKKQ